MGREIRKVGTIEFERSSDTKTTDEYRVKLTDEDAPPGAKLYRKNVNGKQIGCPRCGNNTFAFFQDNKYYCELCLYSNRLTDDDISEGFVKTEV